MPAKRRQRRCRICKTRPPWKDKNCPPDVCKRCYHQHVWSERPAARKRGAVRAATADVRSDEFNELAPVDGTDWR